MNEIYEKNEKIATKFEPSDDEDVVNKAYLNTKLSKIDGHIPNVGKDYKEHKLHCDRDAKQSKDEVLIEKAVKTTVQIHYD